MRFRRHRISGPSLGLHARPTQIRTRVTQASQSEFSRRITVSPTPFDVRTPCVLRNSRRGGMFRRTGRVQAALDHGFSAFDNDSCRCQEKRAECSARTFGTRKLAVIPQSMHVPDLRRMLVRSKTALVRSGLVSSQAPSFDAECVEMSRFVGGSRECSCSCRNL